jgi:hypothetical protein
VDLLKWLRDNDCPWTAKTSAVVAKKGNFEMSKYDWGERGREKGGGEEGGRRRRRRGEGKRRRAGGRERRERRERGGGRKEEKEGGGREGRNGVYPF